VTVKQLQSVNGERYDTIVDCPRPSLVCIPLLQHQGAPAAVIVSEGQQVDVGQPLTASENLFEVPVHASIAGSVQSIQSDRIIIVDEGSAENRSTTEQGDITSVARDELTGNDVPIDRLVSTGNNKASNNSDRIDDRCNNWSRARFIEEIHSAGLVGLGGACYPVAAKIDKLGEEPADILLINAAECDPAICCDEALLSSSISEIATGICLAQLATKAKRTIIGIESDKTHTGEMLLDLVREKAESSQTSLSTSKTELSVVPAAYPNGAESLLMSLCSGRTLSAQDIHNSRLITFNVGTCYALYRALIDRKPYTHRITTLVDSNLHTVNLSIPLGTPVSSLPGFNPRHIVFVGGEMMGQPLAHNAVVTKASSCIQFKSQVPQPVVRPCVRCGLCVDACPVNLMPQYLLAQATDANFSNLQKLRLRNCIECTCCDRVCPSHIPLANIFANAKKAASIDAEAKRQADLAKSRFEKRQRRLETSKQREFKKLSKKQSKLSHTANGGEQAKRRLVEAALQRARDKKGKQVNATDPTNPQNNNAQADQGKHH
jgi:electron transport complex protein RnfC